MKKIISIILIFFVSSYMADITVYLAEYFKLSIRNVWSIGGISGIIIIYMLMHTFNKENNNLDDYE